MNVNYATRGLGSSGLQNFPLQKKKLLTLSLGGLAIITDQVCVTCAHLVTPLLEDEDGNVDKTKLDLTIQRSIKL